MFQVHLQKAAHYLHIVSVDLRTACNQNESWNQRIEWLFQNSSGNAGHGNAVKDAFIPKYLRYCAPVCSALQGALLSLYFQNNLPLYAGWVSDLTNPVSCKIKNIGAM